MAHRITQPKRSLQVQLVAEQVPVIEPVLTLADARMRGPVAAPLQRVTVTPVTLKEVTQVTVTVTFMSSSAQHSASLTA